MKLNVLAASLATIFTSLKILSFHYEAKMATVEHIHPQHFDRYECTIGSALHFALFLSVNALTRSK